ncbi:MAG: hypothetical protein OCD76_06290 [Reichenbachiella sp.]
MSWIYHQVFIFIIISSPLSLIGQNLIGEWEVSTVIKSNDEPMYYPGLSFTFGRNNEMLKNEIRFPNHPDKAYYIYNEEEHLITLREKQSSTDIFNMKVLAIDKQQLVLSWGSDSVNLVPMNREIKRSRLLGRWEILEYKAEFGNDRDGDMWYDFINNGQILIGRLGKESAFDEENWRYEKKTNLLYLPFSSQGVPFEIVELTTGFMRLGILDGQSEILLKRSALVN